MEKQDIWSEEAIAEKPKVKAKASASKTSKTKITKEKKEEKKTVKKEAPKMQVKEVPERLKGILYYPLISEKAVGNIEAQNKITFIIDKNATKIDVKNAIEGMYAVKVEKVRTLRDMHGRKKAIVKLDKNFKAQELATKLGVI